MTPTQWITLGILTVVIIVLFADRLRADLAALLALISLGVTNVVAPSEIFSGFSRSAAITVMAIFILTNGLYRTGVTHWLGRRLLRLGGRDPVRMTLVITLAGAILSWFMNTIAAGAILLPAAIGASRDSGIRLSKLLIPLSFGTLLGGMATLFTAANILVNSGLRDAGSMPFGVLDFLPVGGLIAVTGIVFIATIGHRLLPDRSPDDRFAWAQHLGTALTDLYGLRERLGEGRVQANSPLVGKTIAEGRLGETFGLSVLAIIHNGRTRLAPSPEDRLDERDLLVVVGRHERVQQLAELGVTLERDAAWEDELSSATVGLVEVIIAPRSRVVGQTLKQMNFRQKFGLTVIALWRGGRPYRTDVGDMALQFGDALLLHGTYKAIQVLQSESDFIVLRPETPQTQRPRQAPLAAAIMLGVVTTSAIGWLPIAEAAFAGAVIMILTRCLTMDEAYQAIEWKVVFLIAGMMPLGIALQETGAAGLIGQGLLQTLGRWGALALLGSVYWMAVLLTQFVSGQVTALIVTPIALSAAAQIGADPRSFAMATALACSSAFLTPIAHPVNLLVMGPAGYQPRDFLRIGLPLSVLCFVVVLAALPIFWPL